LHAPLAVPRRLVGVFRTVIEVRVLAVFYARQRLPPRGRMAFQSVGDDDSRDVRTSFEPLPKELRGGCFVAATLDQNIEDMAILIDRPPQIVPPPLNREKGLIQMPRIARPGTSAAQLIGVSLAERAASFPDRLVGHRDAAGKQQCFHIAVTEAEPVVEPHTMADHLCGKAVMYVAVGQGRGVHAAIMPHLPEAM
jgi:hypothetical protein